MSSTQRSSSDFGDARDVATPRCNAVILGMLALSDNACLPNCDGRAHNRNAKHRLLSRGDAYETILIK